jgi:hypothetical protein
MDLILLAIAALLLTALFVTAGRAIGRWRSGWRALAMVIVLCVVGWGAKIAIDIGQDPTSHNLWPFEAAGVAVLALLALGALTLVRWSTRGARRPPGVAQ